MAPQIPREPAAGPPRALLYAIFFSGHALLTASFAFFVYLANRWPDPYSHVWELIPVHFFSGRAGNAGVGLELGFNRWFILFQCCVLDFIIMTLVYPLFVAGFQRASRWPVIGSALSGTHEMALRHKDRIEKYGAVGLMLFVAFPLWSTGPLVGVVLGYILGMRTWITFAAVTVGNVLTTALWIWFFHFLKVYNETLAHVLLAAILITAGAGIIHNAYAKWRRRRRRKAVAALSGQLDERKVGHLAPSAVIPAVIAIVAQDAPGSAPATAPAEAAPIAVPPVAPKRRRKVLPSRRRAIPFIRTARSREAQSGGFPLRRQRKTLRELLERHRESGGHARWRGLRGRLFRRKQHGSSCPQEPPGV